MGYSAYLRPRPETLSGEIEGIIDLANLKDSRRRRLEAKPDLFFGLTYPTADVRQVVSLLDQRFGERNGAPGLFLFEGLKGSGKSHLLLLAYHLFQSPNEARRWLDRHGLKCRLPDGITPVVNKFTDLPLSSIWDFVFEQVTGRHPPRSVVQPSLSDVESALGDRQIVLIFDELEQGVRVLADEAIRAQNIAFLQMLSEWASRSEQVTLLASIYSDQQEPGATLKRVPACRVQFGQAEDRARVVLHRVFENYLDFKPASVGSVVESYVNTWLRHSALDAEAYKQRMLDSYPFTPDLLGIILHRIPARGGFQNVRGALGFLAHLVRITQSSADVITPGHADITDREVGVRLGDLDPGSDLISRAVGNLGELKSAPFATEIASSTLLYTLSGTDSRTHGASKDDLLRSALTPTTDINDFEQGLRTFEKYAAYFHAREGRYFFDREENADAKVELYSLRITDALARKRLHDMWREDLFKEPAAVIWLGSEETKSALEALDKDRLRWVLAPRRLSDDDRRALYHGLSVRNQVVLLEPRDATFDLEGHADLLKWSKRMLAAENLLDMRPDPARRMEYERIAREDRGYILSQIRRGGLLYVRFVAGTSDLDIEEEFLGSSTSKEDVTIALSQQVYPPQLIAEHISARLAHLKGRGVREIDREYRSALGFPVPTHAGSVTRGVRSLCRDRKLGVYHNRGNFCGADPGLTDVELMDATLDYPFGVVEPPSLLPPATPPVLATTVQPPTTTTGPIGSTKGEQVFVRTGSQPGIGLLRQAAAALLQERPSARVLKARFTVFLEQASGDLSSLPVAYRGNLGGPGAITLEIQITKEEELSKEQLEQIVERLPNIPQAEYGAEMTLLLPPREQSAQS